MKYSWILPIAILFSHLCHAQTKTEDPEWSLIIRGASLHTDLYNPTFYWLWCFEGCGAEEQNGIHGKSFNLGVAHWINKRNQFVLLTGYSEFGYHEIGFGSSGSGFFTYESDIMWKFWGIEIEHIWQLYRTGRIRLGLGNGLRFETPISNSENNDVLKPVNMSYNLRLGVQFQLNRTFSILGNGVFKTSLFKYNRAEAVPGYNSYRPYGTGGELGVRINM